MFKRLTYNLAILAVVWHFASGASYLGHPSKDLLEQLEQEYYEERSYDGPNDDDHWNT